MSDPLTPVYGEEVVAGDGCRVWRGRDGVLRHLIDEPTLDEKRLLAAYHALRELSDAKPMPVLVDLRAVRVVTQQAHKAAADPEITRIPPAMAVIVGNPVTRVLGNFAIRLRRPTFHVRLFTDAEAAHQWALEQRVLPTDSQIDN